MPTDKQAGAAQKLAKAVWGIDVIDNTRTQEDQSEKLRKDVSEKRQHVSATPEQIAAPVSIAHDAAIKFIEKRRDDYVNEHGIYDPSTGATEFPGNGDEYVCELEEIIEGLQALTASEQPDKSEWFNFVGSVDGDDALKAAAREAGWALMSLVDGIDWEKRTHTQEIITRLGIALTAAEPEADVERVTLTYTNYRGETAERTITPKRLWFGSTEWHPEPQWLMTAFDHDKEADRDFALKDFGARQETARPLTHADLSDALGSFWNAAIGAAHEKQDSTAFAVIGSMAEGIAAVSTRLHEQSVLFPASPQPASLRDVALYQISEIEGCLGEYLAMPCASLKDRLLQSIRRASAALAQEVGP